MIKTGNIYLRTTFEPDVFYIYCFLAYKNRNIFFTYTRYEGFNLPEITSVKFVFAEHTEGYGFKDIPTIHILTDNGIYLQDHLLAKYILLDIDLPKPLFKINPYPEIKTEQVEFRDASIVVGRMEKEKPITLKRSELYLPDSPYFRYSSILLSRSV